MIDQPLVSVLMTTYNRSQYIGEAIESVLASTYQNFELIVVDDGSKDNTVDIAKSYLKDKRVNVYINEKNLGDYPNRNKAASYATGVYLMYVDSDDKILPDGICKCVSAMDSLPESSFGILGPDLQKGRPYLLSEYEAINRHFFQKPFLTIAPGGTIIKRDYFKKLNCYPVKYGPANDMYFNLKAVASSPVVILPFESLTCSNDVP